MNRPHLPLLAALLLLAAGPAGTQVRNSSVRFDAETISGLGARNIGSATMSGRIAALDAVHEGKRLTVYIGSASGGVWKSTNGGTTFEPVFDKEPVQSIGAVTIDPKNPNVVWIGTGESWTRNSVSIGDGIYKTTDGGETWTNMGLPESERIAKIEVDPTNTDIVYAAVPGKLWSDSNERGLYKTTDGGRSWSLILRGTNPSTGSSDISLDRRNPGTLFAGMWDFRRKPWTFRSGGDSAGAPSGSGLFKTTDGGRSWNELTAASAQGLPDKPWGRVAVTIAPSNSSVIYAFIEAVPPRNGLYRSDDGGKTWRLLDRSQLMVWRPFYFAKLIVDPKDENKLYKPDLQLIASADGGRSFSTIMGGAHGDFHDVWIDPENTDHLIAGDDGGVWYSYDAGDKCWKGDNLPVSQFYHVSIDMDRPYNVYGGLQDNSSFTGPTQYPGGITNAQWQNLYGGDGFWVWRDPADSNYVYAESQGGDIARVQMKSHELRSVQPLPGYKEGKLRFNWNTPIAVSPTHKGTLYIGAQFLFRSRDQGQSWDRISPDLTTNNPLEQRQELSGGVTIDNSFAEMHTSIYAIAESPRNADILWVGTDDGNLQLSRNGGSSWRNVIANIRGLAKEPWVTSVEPGHFADGTAYVTVDFHMFGDMRPYAFKTTDFGASWSPIVAPSGPVRGYAHVIKEDPVDPRLLFLGTELGLWVSPDGGASWTQYKGGKLPCVAVRDLAIHPRDHDLVIATHGRGIWIVDDISPLRRLSAAALDSEMVFVPSEPVVQRIPAFGGWVNGDAAFVGPNPTDQAVITYYQKKRHIFGDLRIEVLDGSGGLIGTVASSKRRGLNRATWSMRMPPPRVPPGAAGLGGTSRGPRVLPGTYRVRLTKGDRTYEGPLLIVMDPRAKYTPADRKAEFDLAMKLYGLLESMTFEVDRINDVRAALAGRAAKLGASDSLASRLHAAAAQVDEVRKKIVATKEGGMITGEERLRELVGALYSAVNFYQGAPTRTQVERTAALARELGDVSAQFTTWAQQELPALNSMLTAKKLEPVNVLGRETWDQRTRRPGD